MSTARKARGMRTQLLVAQYFQDIWPGALSAGSGRSGKDVLNTPGYSFEVKARGEFSPVAFVRQAKGAAVEGDTSVAFYRPNGVGETSIDHWLSILPTVDLHRLIKFWEENH